MGEPIFYYDANNNESYYKCRGGVEYWRKYDANNNEIYYRDSYGGEYWRDSHGKKLDHPPQEKEDTNT
jgi:hypothetical protein